MANSKRKCKHCKEYKPIAQGRISGLGFLCSVLCATEYSLESVRKARKKQNKKELAEYKEKTKNAAQWKREAQTAFNAYIRYRDRDRSCISCGNRPENRLGGTIDAGHYRSRGAAQHLAFHSHNCHAQCVRCNQYLSGNIVEYRKRLIGRIGLEKVEALESDNEVRRFDIEYYKRIKSIFTRKLRLKKKLNKGVDGS